MKLYDVVAVLAELHIPYSQNIYAIQNCGKKQPDLAGKMERLIYRWKRKRDGLVLCMAGGLHSG